VGKDHPKWLVTVANIEFKWLIRGSLLFTALINIGHGWEYRAVEDLAFSYNIGGTAYNLVNGFSLSDYPQPNQDLAYFIYSIVYFVINFGVFFTLNTIIEVKIVRRMHKELKEKRERMAKMNVSSAAKSSLDTVQSDQEKKKKEAEEEDLKKERKVILMVVLNSIFNFVLRAPDILFWMEYPSVWSAVFPRSNYWNEERNFIPGFLDLIADIGYLSYILTFTANFFIFYTFNKNFKEAVIFFTAKSTKSKINNFK
jgi:hypothetical protein